MLLSPVNLEHYVLSLISIEPIEGYVSNDEALYPDFRDAEFGAQINVAEVNGEHVPNSPAYQIDMTLSCSPKSENGFPYRFRVGVTGYISFRGAQVGKERTDIVTVNGCALLYGTLRDVIHTLTMRFSNGPVMLPTVTFLDMRKNDSGAKEKPEVQMSTATKETKKTSRGKVAAKKA